MKSLLLLPLLALPLAAFATGPHAPPPVHDEAFDSLVVGQALKAYEQLPELVVTATPALEFENVGFTPVEIDPAPVAIVIVSGEFRCSNVGRAPHNPTLDFIATNTGKAIIVRHTHPPDFDGFHRWSLPVTHADWTAFTDDGFRRARDAL